MPAHVHVLCPDGTEAVLAPGDLIGRNPRAALPVHDASVSEAHAMVSLRDGALRLLGLRGAFVLALDQPPQTDVRLEAGQTVWLSRQCALQILRVDLPQIALGLEGDGLPRQPLSSVTSLREAGGKIELLGRFSGRALAVLWSLGDDWQLQIGDAARAVGPGDRFTVGGRSYRLVSMPLSGATPTAMDGRVQDRLHVVARYDTVHVQRTGEPVLVLTHTAARIIVSELVALDGPAPWEVVAREVWPDAVAVHRLRSRWDMALVRLRRKLGAARIRSDLVGTDGAGTVELVLYPGDTLDDRT